MLRIFMISFSLVTEYSLSLYVLCVCEIFLIPSDILSIEQRNHIKITTRHFLFTSVSRRLGGSSKNEPCFVIYPYPYKRSPLASSLQPLILRARQASGNCPGGCVQNQPRNP